MMMWLQQGDPRMIAAATAIVGLLGAVMAVRAGLGAMQLQHGSRLPTVAAMMFVVVANIAVAAIGSWIAVTDITVMGGAHG